MARARWKIVEYDGAETVSETTVSGQLSDREVETLLQRLVCRHLSFEEVVGSSLRKNAKGHRTHLDVRPASKSALMCGDGYHYTARFEATPSD